MHKAKWRCTCSAQVCALASQAHSVPSYHEAFVLAVPPKRDNPFSPDSFPDLGNVSILHISSPFRTSSERSQSSSRGQALVIFLIALDFFFLTLNTVCVYLVIIWLRSGFTLKIGNANRATAESIFSHYCIPGPLPGTWYMLNVC